MNPVDEMAERSRREPFFLGWLLEQYAVAEKLTEAALAAELGCAVADLRGLRLCRAPRGEGAAWRADVARVAEALGLDAGRLGRVARRAEVGLRLQSKPCTLLAARDRDEDQP